LTIHWKPSEGRALLPGVLPAQPVIEDSEPQGISRSSTPMEIPRLTSPIDLALSAELRAEVAHLVT
jgi:hypothetical protein